MSLRMQRRKQRSTSCCTFLTQQTQAIVASHTVVSQFPMTYTCIEQRLCRSNTDSTQVRDCSVELGLETVERLSVCPSVCLSVCISITYIQCIIYVHLELSSLLSLFCKALWVTQHDCLFYHRNSTLNYRALLPWESGIYSTVRIPIQINRNTHCTPCTYVHT